MLKDKPYVYPITEATIEEPNKIECPTTPQLALMCGARLKERMLDDLIKYDFENIDYREILYNGFKGYNNIPVGQMIGFYINKLGLKKFNELIADIYTI